MTVMEKFGVPEPQWILEQAESGAFFWRREPTGNNARVKFRCEVEVREFSRCEHELDEFDVPQMLPTSNTLAMSMTFLFCIAVTVFLPWYVMGIY